MYSGSGFHAPSSVRSLGKVGGEGKEENERIRMLENVLSTLFSSVPPPPPPPGVANLWVGASMTGGRYTVAMIILVSTRRGTRNGVRVSYRKFCTNSTRHCYLYGMMVYYPQKSEFATGLDFKRSSGCL